MMDVVQCTVRVSLRTAAAAMRCDSATADGVYRHGSLVFRHHFARRWLDSTFSFRLDARHATPECRGACRETGCLSVCLSVRRCLVFCFDRHCSLCSSVITPLRADTPAGHGRTSGYRNGSGDKEEGHWPHPSLQSGTSWDIRVVSCHLCDETITHSCGWRSTDRVRMTHNMFDPLIWFLMFLTVSAWCNFVLDLSFLILPCMYLCCHLA